MNLYTFDLFIRQYNPDYVKVTKRVHHFVLSSNTHDFIIDLRENSCIFSNGKGNKVIYCEGTVTIEHPGGELNLPEGMSGTSDDKSYTIYRTTLKEVIKRAEDHFLQYAYATEMIFYGTKTLFFFN